MRLGISEKNPLVNIDFRGIGIYSGFNLCDSLEIFTKSAEDDITYRLSFDFKQVRRELLAEQGGKCESLDPETATRRTVGHGRRSRSHLSPVPESLPHPDPLTRNTVLLKLPLPTETTSDTREFLIIAHGPSNPLFQTFQLHYGSRSKADLLDFG